MELEQKENSSSENSIDLRTLFRLFLRRKWWFIATVLIIGVMGFIYIFRIPVLYEVRHKFSLKDDFVEDYYLQYSGGEEKYAKNESVFIDNKDINLIFKTDLIFRSLEGIDEVDDYKDYVDSSMIKIDLDDDTSIFSLKVKNKNEDLANKIALKLIESLGVQIKEQDIKLFENTLKMIEGDIDKLEQENAYFEEAISGINKEISSLSVKSSKPDSSQINYDIIEKNGELLLYKEKIVDNEDEIRKLNELYSNFTEEKNKVENRVELLTKKPSVNVENDRLINSLVVILLSLLSGILIVIVVNYIYKLKAERK